MVGKVIEIIKEGDNVEIKTNINQKIKEKRKEKGITQKQLAERCGLATGTIQQYESGKRKPKIENLYKIAVALMVSGEDLIQLENYSFGNEFDKRRKEINMEVRDMSILRECIVNGEKAYFHMWNVHSYVVEPSPMIGGTPGGQIQYTTGLVEFKDGHMEDVAPCAIRFSDEYENKKRK